MTTSIASLFSGKHAVYAVILVFAPMLPALLLAPLGWGAAIGPFLFAAMAAMLAGMLVGVRFALIITAGVTVANMFALVAAPYPVWAGLVMAATALMYGLTARWGISSLIGMAPVAVGFTIADPPMLESQGTLLANVLLLGLFTALGGLWGSGFGAVLGRKIPHQRPPLTTWRRTVMFAVTMAIVTGVTAALVVSSGIGHTGAWILLTIFLIVQPALHQTFRRSIDRALGTVFGFGIAFLVALLVANHTALLVIGMVFLTFAIYVKLDPRSQYWLFTTFLTPGIVLAEGADADVLSLDVDRLRASLIGVAVALLMIAVFRLLGVRREDDEEDASQGAQKDSSATA